MQDSNNALYIIASDRLDALAEELGELKVVDEIAGEALIGSSYVHPLYKSQQSPIIGGQHVTADSGTGLVHTAPGHGMEDYEACLELGIEPFSPSKVYKTAHPPTSLF